MSQIPRPLSAYLLSLFALFPVDCLLYWLNVGMGPWLMIMSFVAAIGASITIHAIVVYLHPAPAPYAAPRSYPAQHPPIDLTPPEFRQHVVPDPQPESTGDDNFDPNPAVTFPRTARPAHSTTTFPRTLSL